VNVGVLGLGHLGTVTAAHMTSNGHDVWWGDVAPPEVDEIWAVAGRQRRGAANPTASRTGSLKSICTLSGGIDSSLDDEIPRVCQNPRSSVKARPIRLR
jgi:hypothetical protein